MIQILKPIVSLLMFLTVLFFISTILTITTSSPFWLSAALSLACASLAAWFTWKLVSGEKANTIIAVIGGALILGGLFFVIGFLGPMAISKDTDQGPMIGIFIAAPLGVVIGAISGYIYASRQNTGVGER
ncbi:multidrug ABC transporter permease [Nitrosomonas sp.]|uniref:multidrug ABC transporter permease n=1 Tax=Nitrosomonas sp. TaxID=42353 RepID=UPI0025DB97EF|nr:multidrug ABC transporter permease [Nitrosomonas sp.]MBY0485104.1 multidrug ABC transporter permease [Nitrosomonas sp.]